MCKKIEAQAKKKHGLFDFWFHYFSREFADSMAPGGTLPPCPPIAATGSQFVEEEMHFYI